MAQKSTRRAVLIADRTYRATVDLDLAGDGLDQIPNEYFQAVYNGLSAICSSVKHFDTPADFIEEIEHHKNDVVFTIYGGRGSRNRMALVPAICESYGIAYAGADAWGRVVCQDKFLTKSLFRLHSLRTPAAFLVRKLSELDLLPLADGPTVVKPNFEGSSIGIGQDSLCTDGDQIREKCSDLIGRGLGPVLVEDYVPGKEAVVCLMGAGDNIKLAEVVEVRCTSDEDYFLTHLYSADIKHAHAIDTRHVVITDGADQATVTKLQDLFLSLGKMDFLRADVRIDSQGDMHVIELTPDAYIGDDSSFADVYRSRGIDYTVLLDDIIQVALGSCHTQYPSRH